MFGRALKAVRSVGFWIFGSVQAVDEVLGGGF